MNDHLDVSNDHVEGTPDGPGGRTIVVTGAASGIGAAWCVAYSTPIHRPR